MTSDNGRKKKVPKSLMRRNLWRYPNQTPSTKKKRSVQLKCVQFTLRKTPAALLGCTKATTWRKYSRSTSYPQRRRRIQSSSFFLCATFNTFPAILAHADKAALYAARMMSLVSALQKHFKCQSALFFVVVKKTRCNCSACCAAEENQARCSITGPKH